ncbi:phage tail tape measure protein [Streptococcus iniae]|uniref:phage tail tape measure protein n=1 Tax=Streptococcus iniae TaxID=1346 RepID=UPI000EF6FC5E|nr:phage tail tape measure protein [Streptococcus iniae]RLV19000.1 phage tail tape measure protein [Streptococcus iniae]
MSSGKPLGSMFIELGLDTTNFSPNLQSAKREVNYFKAETRALDSALKGNGNNLSLLGTKYKSIEQQIVAQKKVLTQLKAKYDELEPDTAKWEAAAVQIERENAKLNAMENELNQVSSALKRVNAENSFWGRTSKGLDELSGKLRTTSNLFNKFAEATKTASLATGAGLAYAAKKAVDFDGQMQTTRALLRDTTSSVEQLNAQTKKMGDASKGWAKQYGISTTAINDGMQEVIKKGFTFNQTMDAMPAILDAAKASGDDFNTVMNVSTSTLQQFGLEAKDTSRVTDSLSFVANKTASGFEDLGLAMQYVGPVAKSVGMSVETTASAIGLLSNAGIEGQKAGTALRGALSKLLDPAKENEVAFNKLGFTSEQFKTGAIDLPGVLDKIKSSTKGLTGAQKAALISQAFGVEAQSAMNILVDQGGDALKNLSKETENAKGYTSDLAKEMSGSSKSKVDKFKSSLEVLSITVGQKLLPTLTPIIEKVTDLVNKFSEADPATQQLLINLGLITAGAYPVSKALGTVTGASSTVFGWFSKLAKLKATSTAIETVGTSATVATTGVGGLATQGGLLASLLTPGGALAVGLLAGAGLLAYFGGKALEAHERTQLWGTKVNEVEANELSKFKSKVDETNKALDTFGSDSVNDVNSVKTAFQGLVTEIEKLQNKDLRKKLNAAEALGLSEETVNEIKQSSQQTVANAQQMSDEVISIYQNASQQHRDLTAEEKAIVLQNQNELIDTQLSLMNFSAKERKAITKALNGDLQGLNNSQLSEALKTTQKWIEDENKTYKKRKDNLQEMYKSIKGDDEKAVKAKKEIHDKLEKLEASHQAKLDAYGEKYATIQKKLLNNQLKGLDPEMQQGVINSVKKQMEELGLSYEQLMEKTTKASSKIQANNSMWASTTKKASEETKLANSQWNGMVWNQKTGKLRTNVKEEIQKALEAEGGWENLKFIAKNANLSTNARLTMAEVLQETGKWETLTPKEKKLIVDNHQGLKAIADSKSNLAIWDSMPEKVKNILGNNKDFINKKEEATGVLKSWDSMTPEEKKLLAKDMTKKDVDNAVGNISRVKDKTVTITSIFKNIYKEITKHATGTNFHKGGLAMVNDQKGSLYRELVTLPSGQSFIPEGRNVVLPLPRGAKVMKASMTKEFMDSLGIPRYATGVGIPENSKLVEEITGFSSNSQSNYVYDDSKTVSILREILFAIRSSSNKTETGDVYMDANKVGAIVKNFISDSEIRDKRLRGELV